MSESVIETTEAPVTMETVIRGVIAAAKAGHIVNHAKDETKETWEIASEHGTYVVENVNRTSKTQREFNKTNFYRVDAESGVWKVQNLGTWKKKLFYTLLYCLQEGKVFTKIEQDPAKIKTIAKAIKDNPTLWTMTGESIKGTMDGKSIEIIRERKVFETSGKSLYRVKLFEDGVQTMKGSQLMKLWK